MADKELMKPHLCTCSQGWDTCCKRGLQNLHYIRKKGYQSVLQSSQFMISRCVQGKQTKSICNAQVTVVLLYCVLSVPHLDLSIRIIMVWPDKNSNSVQYFEKECHVNWKYNHFLQLILRWDENSEYRTGLFKFHLQVWTYSNVYFEIGRCRLFKPSAFSSKR